MRIRGVLAVALAAAATASSAGQAGGQSQQTPPSAGLVIKGRAPVSNEVLKVRLPKPQEADLANGLHVMVLEDRRLPQVSFQIIVPGAGGYFDPENQVGLAAYTAQMMREGTATRSSQQISQDLERMAATLNVTSSISGQTATISGSALTENFDRLMALTADVLLHPTFPEEEWQRLKTRARNGLVQQRTQPGFLAAEMFSKVVYGAHPAGRVSPTAATLDAIGRDAMQAFHRTRFVPDRAAIAFAGDISLAEARAKVAAALGAWARSGSPAPEVQDPAPPGPPQVYLVSRPGSVQTSLVVGTQSMARTNPDYIPLTVANRVLGGTMGRLFRHLREEKGYTYGVGSAFSATRHVGAWQASTDVRTDVTEAALTDLLAEIEAMRTTPVPESELMDAKRAIVAGFALSLERPQQVLGYYVDSWMYGLPADYWDTYPAKIGAVTAAQAQAAAAKYWSGQHLQIVAVGDVARIADALRAKGTLQIFDVEGRPVK